MEIRNTYLVRIWYVLTLVRNKCVFASLNTPFGTYLVRICFSKYVFRILIGPPEVTRGVWVSDRPKFWLNLSRALMEKSKF